MPDRPEARTAAEEAYEWFSKSAPTGTSSSTHTSGSSTSAKSPPPDSGVTLAYRTRHRAALRVDCQSPRHSKSRAAMDGAVEVERTGDICSECDFPTCGIRSDPRVGA